MQVTLYGLLIALKSLSACSGSAQEIILANNNSSEYHIVVPAEPTKLEQRSATVFQKYFQLATGVQLPVTKENKQDKGTAIYIGNTGLAARVHPRKLTDEGYLLQAHGKDIIICGGSGKGLIYGVYNVLETYLGCRKIANDPTIVHATNKPVTVPGNLRVEHAPQFIYREVYYPASHDAEYLEWNQLHELDDLWGLWGHSFFKLVPTETYFKAHPEYYALVKGKRQASQLCLTNEDVYKIVVADLKRRMEKNPDAIYWSVSPNDDNGNCECDKCRAIDDQQGSPAGSLIKFVNRVAAAFPDKKFTTLAYGYTHRPPKTLKPSDNVYVFLSDIDAYRDKPLADEGSAAGFRADLKGWNTLTGNIFIWDYITEFTNYLAPFPNFHTLEPNIRYLKENGVKGIFEQGSGDTYSEWAELRSYVTAKLLEDDKASADQLIPAFFHDYYGEAGKYLEKYLDLLHAKMIDSKRKLDIYGNPINEWKSYLTPELIEQYSVFLDKAEAAAEGNATIAERVMRARLPIAYTVLQQARFYGIEKHGIFEKDNSGKWIVKPKLRDKVETFVANCNKAGVTELSEAGLSPNKYLDEWNTIFDAGVTPTKALGASVAIEYPFAEDYPAKGNRTLIDGNPGYNDFSYNWLCFYGVPLVATIDLGKAQSISRIKMHFLDDPRHWIFHPERVSIDVSSDGNTYHTLEILNTPTGEEHYDVTVKDYTSQHAVHEKVRYIRVTANNLQALPAWRYRPNKKPMIACDEIYVQ